MSEGIFNKEQELAGHPPRTAFVPGRNGLEIRGVVDPNRTMPGGEGASPPLDMSIFGSRQGGGGQLGGYAQSTVNKVLDRVRDLNLYPDGSSKHGHVRGLVGQDVYGEIAAKGGNGPRFEREWFEAMPAAPDKGYELNPDHSDITDTPGMPEYRDKMKLAETPEDAADFASRKGTALNMAGIALGTSSYLAPPLALPAGGFLAAGYLMDKYGKDYYTGTYVVDKEDPQRERDREEIPKFD